jgi:hypothetical protein
MSEIGGLLLQITGNRENEIHSLIPQNIAMGYNTYDFNMNNEIDLNMYPLQDEILPECIILSGMNHNNDLSYLERYMHLLTFMFTIGDVTIVKIPFSFLWNLEQPIIMENKVYLKIPFHMFFGNVRVCGLTNYIIKFSIEYSNINYNSQMYYHQHHVTFSLLCKTFFYGENIRFDTSNNCIQQINSIQLNTLHNESSDEFRIRTNRFRGFVKGFFIESPNVFETMRDIKFFTNQFVRFHYDAYLIRQKCVKISDSIMYFPFHPDMYFPFHPFHNNTNRSYVGSINFDGIENHFLNLQFSNARQQVRVYALSKNNYSLMNRIFVMRNIFVNFHVYETFETHPLTPIEHLLEPFFQQNIAHYDVSFNDMPYISQTLYRKICEQDQNICPIRQTEIQENERYMLCDQCKNCYNEISLIQWFEHCNNNNGARITCPTCRSIWTNYNVYINSLPISDLF